MLNVNGKNYYVTKKIVVELKMIKTTQSNKLNKLSKAG